MTETLLTAFDNFTPRAKQIREEALRSSFAPVEYLGHTYMGINKDYDPDLHDTMARVLGARIRPKLSFFRLGLENDETTSWIHADVSVGTKYASILYLSDPIAPLQGTAFWKHNRLGVDATPDPTAPNYAEWINANKDELNGDAGDPDKWTHLGLIGMKFNRFVVYPTKLFHSRFPRNTWGKENDEGRLIWVCFFDA